MKIFWYKLTSIDSNFWGGCRQKAYANSKLIDNNFAANQDFSTINNKFLSIITFMEKHKESKKKFELHTVPSPIHADDGQIEYISVNFHNWDIHIWSWQQFTSLITNEGGYLIKSLLARLDDHPVEDLDPNPLTTKRKPMNERMGKRTEIDLEEIVKANMKELLTTIDFNNMKDQMDYTFNIVEQEGIEEEKLIMKEPLYDYNTSKIYRDLCIDKSESLNHFWSEDRMHGFLLKRKKGQHLTKDEIHYITQQLQRCPRSSKIMQRKYWLSRATIRRIWMKMNVDKEYENSLQACSGNTNQISRNGKQLIKNYLSPPWEPKSISMIKSHIKSELNETYSDYKIRSFITKEMKYTYKKGNSRPPVYSSKRTQLIKTIFCTELLTLVAKGEVIINCDESSFDRSAKRQFSWLPLGESWPIINDKIKGRASLILATWNTGEWIGMVVQDTIDSQKFWFFLELLESILKQSVVWFGKSPIIILDNARTHSSKITKNKIKMLDMQVRFLAPYWPEVAPVERIFGRIKSKLRSIGGTLSIDFSRRKGIEVIFGLIFSISNESWQKAWLEVIKEAKKFIIDSYVKMRWNLKSD